MRRVLLTAAVTVIIIVAVVWSFALAYAAAATAATCQEDQRCWNWPTMGNHHRGVQTRSGNTLIVSPCEFRVMWRSGYINRHTVKPMRGDAWARHHGCER